MHISVDKRHFRRLIVGGDIKGHKISRYVMVISNALKKGTKLLRALERISNAFISFVYALGEKEFRDMVRLRMLKSPHDEHLAVVQDMLLGCAIKIFKCFHF